MPPPLSDCLTTASLSSGQREEGERQRTPQEVPALTEDQAVPPTETAEAVPSVESDVDIYSAPPAPTTVMEALEQRLNKYRSAEQAARDDGDDRKVRRMGRIVKQYENAIKLHSAGKPIPLDELPTPPGILHAHFDNITRTVQVFYVRCRP